MSFTAIALSTLLLALLALSMREAGVKGAPYILLGAGILVLLPLVERLSALVGFFRQFAETGSASSHAVTVLKVMGVGYLTQLASDTCRESGSAVLAERVELCGKLEILIVCLPYLEELLGYALSAVE